LAQSLFIDHARETAREARRKLVERENVQSMLALPRGIQAPFAHRVATVSNYCVAEQAPLRYCRFAFKSGFSCSMTRQIQKVASWHLMPSFLSTKRFLK
jgi:hypothetical protein